MIGLEQVTLARHRLSNFLQATPLEESPSLGSVWLKLENANRTHSFKARGALNAMLALTDEQRARGVVAASTGNHAQGVAYAARLLGVQARIVMPVTAARRKVNGVRKQGAQAIMHGETYDDAEREARRLQLVYGLAYVSPYNDEQVVAGGGTVGLEIYDALPTVRRVIVPVGGGGLISGVGAALKGLNPAIEIIGVNARVSPEMYNAFYGASLPCSPETLADALPGSIEEGSITLELVKRYVDRIVLVDENSIASAMRWLIMDCGWLVEGGGAVGVAALRANVIEASEAPTVIVLSGGNVDSEVLHRVLGAASEAGD